MTEHATGRRSILDSPWYWAYAFVAAALAALFLMGPRFTARQAQIERNYQGRQRAAQYRAGERPSTPLSDSDRTTIQLWPLYLILSALLVITGAGLLWRGRSGRRAADGPPMSSPLPRAGPPQHGPA